jgi:hypothetical protein
MTIEFNWKYYAYGAYVGTLRIYWRESNGTMNLLRTISGQQHTGTTQTWLSYTENLSTYAGTTGRIVLRYGGHTYWQADVQLDAMQLVGTTAGTISFDPNTVRGYSGSQPHWIRSNTYQNNSTMPSFTGGTWAGVTTTTSTSTKWNYDNNGTPSSSTGGILDSDGWSTGYYLYAESSSPNYNSYGTTNLWAAMAQDYTLSSGAPTTIGTVTISGSSSAQIGASYGPYTYTASINGNAANPVYTWSIPSGGTLASSSGNQGIFNFTSAGTRTVQVVVTDSNATDSPVTQTYSVSVTVGTLYLGTPTVSGAAAAVISTSETYTVGNITDATTLTDETYTWSITGTGSTSGGSALQASGTISINDLATQFGGTVPHSMDEYYKGGANVPNISVNASVPTSGQISLDDFYGAAASAPLTFTGQGTTSITTTWPSTAGTYSVACVVSSATASDSPKTATLAITTAASTNTLTSPTLGSVITGGWSSYGGDQAGGIGITGTSFIIGKVYSVDLFTDSTTWVAPANGNFRLSSTNGLTFDNAYNNLANGPNQTRAKRMCMSAGYGWPTSTTIQQIYQIEQHGWPSGQSSSAGYIYRRFYDTSSTNSRGGNNPTITTYGGSQTYPTTNRELGTTIDLSGTIASGGYGSHNMSHNINFGTTTSGWVRLSITLRSSTSSWSTSSGRNFYFRVYEVQSNGNTDVMMCYMARSGSGIPNTTFNYSADQWFHFDNNRSYRINVTFSPYWFTRTSGLTEGPIYADLRTDSTSGALWHTFKFQTTIV